MRYGSCRLGRLGRLLAELGVVGGALVGVAAAGAGAAADLGAFLGPHELKDAELRAVANAGLAELDDARVAARAIGELRRHAVEDVLHELGGLAQFAVAVALDLAAGGEVEEGLPEVAQLLD